MHALKVQVKNGGLVLDEPTDLPDGAEVEVVAIVAIEDELSPDERAGLHASLDRALDDSDAGRGMDAAEYLAQYRARREARLSATSSPAHSSSWPSRAGLSVVAAWASSRAW